MPKERQLAGHTCIYSVLQVVYFTGDPIGYSGKRVSEYVSGKHLFSE